MISITVKGGKNVWIVFVHTHFVSQSGDMVATISSWWQMLKIFVKNFRSTFATSSPCCHCAGSRTEFAVLGNFHGCGLPHWPSAYSKVLFLCWLTCFHSIQWIAFKYPRLVGPALFVSFFVFTLLEGEFILPSQFGESLKVFTVLPYTAAASIHKIRLKASVLNIHTTSVVAHVKHLEAILKLICSGDTSWWPSVPR